MDKLNYERINKGFYDFLEQGKIMGRKCPACGHIEFPPYIACNDCGNFETEWVDVADYPVVATSLVPPSMLFGDPEFQERFGGDYCYATVQVEGADEYNTCIINISSEQVAELSRKVPIALKPAIVQHEGYKMVFWEIA